MTKSLRDTAQALLDNWDTPEWNKLSKRAELMAGLRAVLVDPTPVSSLSGKAEAFDRIVAAQKTAVDAAAAYNSRLEVVRAERNRGNWSVNVDTEYKALSDAQHNFNRVVGTEVRAALSATATEGEPQVDACDVGRAFKALRDQHPDKFRSALAKPSLQKWFVGQIMGNFPGGVTEAYVSDLVEVLFAVGAAETEGE